MDIIFLEQVIVETTLGVPAWERLKPQKIILDIEIGCDLSTSCKTDAIDDTIDYAVVVDQIRGTLAEHSFHLVEALADHVCQLIINEFKADHVKIKVAKPAVLPGLKALGVIIERSRP